MIDSGATGVYKSSRKTETDMPDAKQFLDNAMQDVRGWLASYEQSGKVSDLRMVQHWLEQALRQAETLDKH